MCLNTITKTYKPNKRIRNAYKWVKYSSKEIYYSKVRSVYTEKELTNEFIIARNITLKTEQFISSYKRDTTPRVEYLSGFHCYLTKEDALKSCWSIFKLIKVQLRDIRYIGTDGSNSRPKTLQLQCIVANEIRIHPDEYKEGGLLYDGKSTGNTGNNTITNNTTTTTI